VRAELLHLLEQVPQDHPMFGQLQPGVLRMPRAESPDGRALTWPKLLDRLAGKLLNKPQTVEWCWFATATKDDGYHELKICLNGSTGKYRTARALRVLVEPDKYDTVNDRDENRQALHRCGRGKARHKKGPSCINPYHIYFGTRETNEDTKGCRYGAMYLCPHTPKCVFTDPESGAPIPCFNLPTNPGPCHHNPPCVHKEA